MKQINKIDPNITIPFIPSVSWKINGTDVIDPQTTSVYSKKGNYFSYIRATFDATQVTDPVLAVYSGNDRADGTPIVSPVEFAFSGERVQFKGIFILTEGQDINGNTITSTAIGNTPATDIKSVTAYGGIK
jgi:hypothetical protein